MEDNERDWQAVIGRALAFLCLANADVRDKGLLPQAKFLETLGLNRQEAANLLGTKPHTLSELFSRERRASARKGRHAKGKR
jgi:hypothetical protein